jgi:predicted permease
VRASGLPEGKRAQAAGVLTFATVIAALVLLVTCANIAGVLQSRAVARTQETSIRYALGASRFRVVRQWLTESVCLAIMGAAAGLLVQQALRTTLTGILRAASPQQLAALPVADIRTLVFTFAVAIASGMAFGLLPALRSAARGEAALRETAAAILGRRAGARGTRLLVALQVAVCLGLLITAGLLARSLRNSTTFDPGFDGSGLVVARVDLRRLGYDAGRGRAFHDALAARLGERPEVRAISRATVVPLGGDQERLGMRIAGHTTSSGSPVIPIDVNAVGPDYFSALEIPLVRGRGITSADGPHGRPVVVINEAMAKRYWPSADPIGQTITLAGRSPVDLAVIGVAKDIKYYSLDEAPRPYAYLAADQSGGYGGAVLHVRVTGDPGRFVSTLRREAALVDPAVSLDQAMSFDELRQQPLALRRTISVLTSVFGAIALLLAAVGIYGTMSQVVGQRTREIGVRMAFGAQVEDIFRLVVGQGMRPVLAGLVLGIGAAAGISRLVASELFGVTPADPLTHAVAIAAVLFAALVALLLPARRATRVDPVTTLRST